MGRITLANCRDRISGLVDGDVMADRPGAEDLDGYLRWLTEKLPTATGWDAVPTFWPPRCVRAVKEGRAAVFFGAGLSMPCGVPSWSALLENTFGLESALINDDDLASDPLTLAELAGEHVGHEALQTLLRKVMAGHTRFSVSHTLIALLDCPAYITTNYDGLFEKAWAAVRDEELKVVTNDGDLPVPEGATPLFKIHGDAALTDEHLILTRRDYRVHYRANDRLFGEVRRILRDRHTIFIGFSHKDPEVSRLVEDVIYDYEQGGAERPPVETHPQLYSLQFDMRTHTPEVFAARGLVALTPALTGVSGEVASDVRTRSLSRALADLLGSSAHELHDAVYFDDAVRDAADRLETELGGALQTMADHGAPAAEAIRDRSPAPFLADLLSELGDLASQGVYLVDESGELVDAALPAGLSADDRVLRSVRERPYFQQAKSFREPFVSNAASSVFNQGATFFSCLPVKNGDRFRGLLFAASQIGQWRTPIEVATPCWDAERLFLLVDANGICLLPPMRELEPEDLAPAGFATPEEGLNVAYPYERLLSLSRRDALVRHVTQSVVPVAQDDDILRLADDLSQFTVVRELRRTRWKIGISVPLVRSADR